MLLKTHASRMAAKKLLKIRTPRKKIILHPAVVAHELAVPVVALFAALVTMPDLA